MIKRIQSLTITKIRKIEMIKNEEMNLNQKNISTQNLITRKILSQIIKINIKQEVSKK